MKVVCRMLAALLAAPALLLSSCSDDTDPGSHWPTATLSPTPSSSSTASPTRETPQHFIRRFYVAEKQMENSGETAPYSRLITHRCVACTSLIRRVRHIYRGGGFIHWGGLRITSINAYGEHAGRTHTYAIRFIARPTRYREYRGSGLRTLRGGRSTDVLTLVPLGDQWVVKDRSRLAS